MKRISFLFLVTFLLAACTPSDTETTRPPLGNPDGVVKVVEYTDLQCPACRAVHIGVVKPLLAKYGSVIRFDLKHFPLRAQHRYALDAAESSECAADQGKFWEFIDLAFEKQDALSYPSLLAWAQQLKLDGSKFENCWKSRRKKDLVLADYNEGRALGVEGTPAFFVNGVQVQAGFDTLSAAVDKALGGYQQRL